MLKEAVRCWPILGSFSSVILIQFSFLFIHSFILLLAALALPCWAQAFSSCVRAAPTLQLRCMGFFLRWLLLLLSVDSRHTGFSNCGAHASLSQGKRSLPGLGTELVSPALAGGFLTTRPPEKSMAQFFNFLTL